MQPVWSKAFNKLSFGLSHLRGHKLKHNFRDYLSEICMCGKDNKSTNFLQYSLFFKERQVLMNKIRNIDISLTNQNEISLFYTLLFGKENMNDSEKPHA